ncbi:MAG: 3-deoxy-D-manno-octulosonic acid transferase [Rhodobacteraceae bacterium]|nr:3-deoxy-D-manno-octulosonic acid transferase [Paracoccaceae bacterium]
MSGRFPTARLRAGLALYTAAWILALPLVLGYFFWRSRRDPHYRAHLAERFGRGAAGTPGSVWVHAVSLGELRSAVPLIEALLDRGEPIVITTTTPAGRREAERVFGARIAAGRVALTWCPLEFGAAYRRFFARFAPKYGLVMEIEIWPRMIAAAHRAGVPLFLCNSQYPLKSYERDKARGGLRAGILAGLAGVFAKSDLQAKRFAALGAPNVHVTGELRFDQPIPKAQLDAAEAAKSWLGADTRPIITIASAIEGEDAAYAEVIRAVQSAHSEAGAAAPLFIYVPRAPERFGDVAEILRKAGLKIARRSAALDAALAPKGPLGDADVLVGDSMGEMYFYLAPATRVIVGGGFHPKGAHNIIEPLALQKPVLVGPHIWTIENPGTEAIEAGVLTVLPDRAALVAALAPGAPGGPAPDDIARFFKANAGSVARTLSAIDAQSGR